MRLERRHTRRLIMLGGNVSWRYVGIGLLLLSVVLSCRKAEPGMRASKPPEAALPDVSRCTRVEIELLPSALRWLWITPDEEDILSRAELEYVQSMDTIVSTDAKVIGTLATGVREAEYKGTKSAVLRTERWTSFRFYHHDVLALSFIVRSGELHADGGRRFEAKPVWRSLSEWVEPLWPYQWRVECRANLRFLYGELKGSFRKANDAYPACTEWCDVVQPKVPQPAFLCPALGGRRIDYYTVHQQTSHYAINPACEPNSPANTVLLFETRAGWNQHGGPELFTFDNHNPRGGCVLLNDGTVKFIRTEEELHRLRWK